MNWKLALALFATLALCLSACHQEKETKPKPKAKAAECKLAGGWALDQTGDDVEQSKKRTLSFSFNDGSNGTTASGKFQIGTRPEDPSSLRFSPTDVTTIEDGGSANVEWTFGNVSESCKVKFVDECKDLEFSCPNNDTFRIGRE